MKQLILEMHGSHELLVSHVQKHKVGTGGQQVSELEDLEVIKREMGPTRKLKEHMGNYGDLASGVVFTKTLFWQMIGVTGKFISLRHVDEEGWTSTALKFKGGRDLVGLLTMIAVPSFFWAVGLAMFGELGRIGWAGLIWVPVLSVLTLLAIGFSNRTIGDKLIDRLHQLGAWVWSYSMGPGAFIRRLRNMSQGELTEIFFPDGHDEPREILENSDQIRVRVTLPNRPADIQKRMDWLKQIGRMFKAEPLIIAHREAVGLSLEGVRVVRSADPFFCLETHNSVIVFPDISWGESVGEQELIQIIRDKFPHFSVARQN